MLPIRVDKNEPHDIFIGRPSKFSNPYVIGVDGTRAEVIQKFENYFKFHPQLDEIINELSDKRVACWCSLQQHCHFDVVLKIIKRRQLNNLFIF